MPYLALYRKYRPQTFKEVYGQKAVVRTLENAFKENKIGHAYLFCGPRGTGKTSMARLFAKALNCAKGFGEQCCECDSCKAVAAGDHPDVIEMDAASNSSVDDVRDIISQVDYQPIMGRYRVYIIDEVHNMSSSAFNALLKTLEEPPANVVFILCTTEPQKVLPTILSRVQRFDFSRVSDADLTADLTSILKSEKVHCDDKALAKIVRLADGGVRDALSLLDQAISYCGDDITEKDVEELFGLVDSQTLCELLSLAYKSDVAGLLKKAREMIGKGADLNRAVTGLIAICRDLLIHKANGGNDLLTEITTAQAKDLDFIPAYQCNSFIEQLIKAQRNFRYSKDLGDSFELALLEMAVPMLHDNVNQTNTAAVNTSQGPQIFISSTPAEEVKDVKAEEISVTIPGVVETPAAKPTPVLKAIQNEQPAQEPKQSITVQPVKNNAAYDFPSEKDILNLMNQGSKELREKINAGWNDMEESCKEDKAALLAIKSGVPKVCNEKGVLLVVPLQSMANKINSPELVEGIKRVLKKNFDIDAVAVATSRERYKKLVEVFREKFKAKELPEKYPVSFDRGQPEHKITNAQRFVDELKASTQKGE